jgi:hypothetical protein
MMGDVIPNMPASDSAHAHANRCLVSAVSTQQCNALGLASCASDLHNNGSRECYLAVLSLASCLSVV